VLYVDKLIAQLAFPLSAAIALALLALVLSMARRGRLARLVLSASIVILVGSSLPVVSDALRGSLEGQFRYQPVVVLGGGVEPRVAGWPYANLADGADRVWHAARIYRAGKAGRVVLSGGGQPWHGRRESEAAAMATVLHDLGVPEEAIILEGQSRNTRENAVKSAIVLDGAGISRVILVTSAMHMSRALGAFRAAGVSAVPAATDFRVAEEPMHFLRFLPDAGALAGTTQALREYMGLWAYRWRGWAE
jgi:uncharacterized SAM-binding protein YcdF (DUF218 family)